VRLIGRGSLLTLGCVAVWVLLAPTAAYAHTSLEASTPANRSVLSEAPSKLTLVFVNEVDPGTVTIEVRDASGETFDGVRRITPDTRDEKTIEFALPELPDAVYGVQWQSVGPDGHRAVGEVVFGIGDVSESDLRAVAGSGADRVDQGIDVGAGIGRFVWYAGLGIAVGALYVLWWARGQLDAGTQTMGAAARRWLPRGASIAIAGVTAGWLAAVFVQVRAGNSFFDALAADAAMAWLLTAVALVAVRVASAIRNPVALAPLAVGLAIAVVASVSVRHAPSGEASGLVTLLTAAHLAAAAVWVGPLAVVSVMTLTRPWREIDPKGRRDTLSRFFTRYALFAGCALLVLVLTGVRALWVNVGDRILDNTYGAVLLVKVALIIGIIIPLAFFHDRRVRSRAAPVTSSVGGPSFLRSVSLEVLAITVVLGLAAALVGLDPGFGNANDEKNTAAGPGAATSIEDGQLATPVVSDVSQCAELSIGGPNCYRDYFSALLRSDGPTATVDQVDALQARDHYVAANCHQLTHDIGRDAAKYYGSLGQAFSYEASACAAGYYHGVVEQVLSKWSDTRLESEVSTACAEVATPRYGIAHYNCVHGLGHGVMLRFNGELFRSLPYCDQLADQWEYSSCLSGAFMQNIISAQEDSSATLRPGDLQFPCNAVEERQKPDCWRLQSSYVLWQVQRDYARGFAVCDAAESAYRDECYQSMGRDISGNAGLDVGGVIAGCEQGGAELRVWCYWGAAQNAVYTEYGTDSATALCDALDPSLQPVCTEARDLVASTLPN
jgi:methionine-rich copper-binding protein CopC/putative copper export protein